MFLFQGLRVQDTKEICPWEILEGVKNSGPLMLSWFGAVRMKRKPLWFEEQRHLVRFHAHQNQFQNYVSGPHTVMLPSEEAVPIAPPATTEEKPEATNIDASKPSRTISISGSVSGEAMEQGVPTQPHPPGTATPIGGSGLTPLGMCAGWGVCMREEGGRGAGGREVKGEGGREGTLYGNFVGSTTPRAQEQFHAAMRAPMMAANPQVHQQYMPNRQAAMNEQARQQQMKKLRQIRDNQIRAGGQPHMQGVLPPPMYPGSNYAAPGMVMPNYGQIRKQQQLQAFQQHHQLQQRRLHLMRMQQQQQIHQQQMMSQQYGYQAPAVPPGMHAGMRPMQANPPMQMQQVIQQTRQYPAMMAPPTGMSPGRQPGMQYPPQQAPPGMNQMMAPRPGGMY